MPSDIAKAMLEEKSDEVEPKESFENFPSLSIQPVEETPESESIPSIEDDDLFFWHVWKKQMKRNVDVLSIPTSISPYQLDEIQESLLHPLSRSILHSSFLHSL